ncbi:MAG: molybdopterin molybdotransferase MoeA [Gammaproteobacteria bacterium]|nr:molybdopterin molybdotransferase MoeA [Gammaproteobacteria bacterium]
MYSASGASDFDSAPVLSVEQARRHLVVRALPMVETEVVATESALGRVLAEDQCSPINVPGADSSAMDGYALTSHDCGKSGQLRLGVSQRIAAGQVGRPLAPATAARIFTGAWLPSGAAAVVMQEHCRTESDGAVVITGPVTCGVNVRHKGEDIAVGACLLSRGRRLRAPDLGLAGSMGLARLPVFRRLRVALVCTGNELVEPGAALGPGQIYNSNRYTLSGLIQGLGCERLDIGQVPDDAGQTREVLERAAEAADVVIAAGGVSVGEEDHVKAVIRDLGNLDLMQVAIKPGKPFVFGRIGTTPFLGLPGNPVSAFVTFCLFARPFILCSQGVARGHGGADAAPRSFPVVAGFEWSGEKKRREYLRARLRSTEDGAAIAEIYPNQGSAVLSSATWAEGLVEVPECQRVAHGQTVRFLPFSDLLS